MKRFAMLLITSLLPFSVQAAFECNVKVLSVLVYNSGMVNVTHSGRNDYTMICSLSTDYGGVSPSTCAMWTAMLQSIKKKNGTAQFYFYETAGSCATMATYGSAPVPGYIGDITP